MNFDSYVRPVWQLPVGNDGGYIHKSAKYHCFVDNKSLCGRYGQCADFYDEGITMDSREIVRWPQIACKNAESGGYIFIARRRAHHDEKGSYENTIRAYRKINKPT